MRALKSLLPFLGISLMLVATQASSEVLIDDFTGDKLLNVMDPADTATGFLSSATVLGGFRKYSVSRSDGLQVGVGTFGGKYFHQAFPSSTGTSFLVWDGNDVSASVMKGLNANLGRAPYDGFKLLVRYYDCAGKAPIGIKLTFWGTGPNYASASGWIKLSCETKSYYSNEYMYLPFTNMTADDLSLGMPDPGQVTAVKMLVDGTTYAGQDIELDVLEAGCATFDELGNPACPHELPSGKGCTPGYWKNHPISWESTQHKTGDAVGSVFAQAYTSFPVLGESTLLKALSFKGGTKLQGAAANLLRAAVAALLTRTGKEVQFPVTRSVLIADVNAALASGDRPKLIELASKLDAFNNLGCPLTGKVASESIEASVQKY